MHDMLILIGASGHGKVVADVAKKMNQWHSICFLDDNTELKHVLNYDVIGTVSEAVKFKDEADFFVSIGDNENRKTILEKLMQLKCSIATLVHPNAVLSEEVVIEEGTVIMAGVVINSSTKIGKGCIINTSSSVDHDNCISDYVHVSPGVRIAGNVSVGHKSWLGIGSSIVNNLRICADCKIGAGSVVINDLVEPGTYLGAPARRL